MSYAANPNKPKKTVEETEAARIAKQQKADRERIRRLIISLGSENKKVLGQIRGLVGALEDDMELHGELIAETLLECAKFLPLKTTIFAAWVGRMAEKHSSWCAPLIARILAELRTALQSGQVVAAQLLLRFLVCLGNIGIIGLTQVVRLLREVLALSDGQRPSKGGDLGVYLTLASLPFISPAAYGKISEAVESLMEGTATYLAGREATWKGLLRVVKNEDLPDRLEALASAVQALSKADWSCEAVAHVPGFEPSLEGHPDLSQTLELGVSADDIIRKGKVRLQVFLVPCRFLTGRGAQDGANGQMAEQDRWVLEDDIITTIDMFNQDVEECAKQLLRIPVLHAHFEAIVIETVFSQMLRLPSPPLLPLFYCRLLETLMHLQNSMTGVVGDAYAALFERIPQLDEDCLEVLAETFAYHLVHTQYQTSWAPFTGDNVSVQVQRFVRRTFERLQRLSFHQNLLHRLPEAVHVYVPPEPSPANNLPVQAKPEFAKMVGLAKIKEPNEKKVLEFCHRLLKLSTKDEPREEPEASAPGVAPPVEDKVVTESKVAGEGEGEASVIEAASVEKPPSAQDGGTVEAELPAAKKRKVAEQAIRVKQEVKQEEEGSAVQADGGTPAVAAKRDDDDLGEAPAEPWTLESVAEILTVAVFQNGAKTPTHMSKMLDGHHQVLIKLRPTDDEDLAHSYNKVIVHCTFEFWRSAAQRLEITLAALLHRGVVTPRAVIEHSLAERGPQGCDSISVWHIVNTVARKSLEKLQTARAELAMTKKLGNAETLQRCRDQLEVAIQETAELFTLIFTGLVRNHQDYEEKDQLFRHITLQRVLTIGRKYHAFIKPLIESATSRIPGVAHNPEIAAIFQSLCAL